MSTAKAGGLVELPTPSAWAIREGIGESLWHFSSTQKAAQSMVGYKDSVEPLFTAEQMRVYARATLTALVERAGEPVWRPIETAPAETDVWVFDPECEPEQYVAILTEGFEGPYWRPRENLVADALAENLAPTHWQPLPLPPSADEAKP